MSVSSGPHPILCSHVFLQLKSLPPSLCPCCPSSALRSCKAGSPRSSLSLRAQRGPLDLLSPSCLSPAASENFSGFLLGVGGIQAGVGTLIQALTFHPLVVISGKSLLSGPLLICKMTELEMTPSGEISTDGACPYLAEPRDSLQMTDLCLPTLG